MRRFKGLAERKSFGKVAKQGVALSFVREGVTEVLLFPASMVMARLLSPREFGISTAALFFIQLASRLSELGFNAALVRAKVIDATHLSSVFVINIGVGALAFVILAGMSPLIGSFYGVPETGQILPIAALSFLIAPFGAVPAALLARDVRYREATLIDWYYGLTFAIVGCVLAWLGFSFWSLVYARVASVVVQTAARIYYARWRPSLQFSRQALREVLSFAVGMHVKRLLDYSAANVDNLVVGKLMGMTSLGLYDKAFSTMNRFLGRMNTGGPNVMFRIFALIHEQPDRFRRAYSKVVMSATLLGFPVFAVLIATAPQLMVVLFGARWLPAAAPFQVLCAAAMLRLLNSYASAATQAAGWIWSEVWRQLAFILLLVGTLVALRAWGPVGAATGVLIATATMSLLMHALLRRVTHLSWGEILQPQIPALLCAAVTVASVLLVQFGLHASMRTPPDWLLLACQSAGAVVSYAIFMLFAPHAELRALVHEMTTDLAPAFLKRQRWMRIYLGTPTEAGSSPVS